MSLDPRLLRSFVVLAEELHFGRAAARLHIAQPALSQQIRRLELQVGARVFERSRVSVRLTELGEALLVPARAAVDAAAAAQEVARAFAAGERGELRLGFSPGAHYWAQTLLAEFARRRPAVHVRARQDSTQALVRGVAAGELELAVGFCAEPAAGVRCERLAEADAVVAVAEKHPLAGRGSVSLHDLRTQVFALVDEVDGAGYNAAVVRICRAAGFDPRTIAAPRGPMIWETSVRTGSCVGLTTRSAAVSTARATRLLALEPPAAFAIDLVAPLAAEPGWRAPARAFAELTRELAASGRV